MNLRTLLLSTVAAGYLALPAHAQQIPTPQAPAGQPQVIAPFPVGPYTAPVAQPQPVQQQTPFQQYPQQQPAPILQPGMAPAAPASMPSIPTLNSQPFAGPPKPIRQRDWNAPKAAPHQWAPGAAQYTWQPGIVIHTRLQMPTTIIFPANIYIVDALPGAPTWINRQRAGQNSFQISALVPDIETGITFITNAGIFFFTLRTYTPDSAPFITDQLVHVDLRQPAAAEVAAAAVPAPMPTNNSSTSLIPNETTPSALFGLLPDYAKPLVLAKDRVAMPHRAEERTKGDWQAIGPLRIWEDSYRTYFEFGPEHRNKPLPVIAHLNNGVNSVVTTELINEQNGIHAVHKIGSFVLTYDQAVVCIIKTNEADYGVRNSKPRAAE